jgi:hypothetical protein
MKTAHQFARELLAGPDLPIIHPIVLEYADDAEHSGDPVVSIQDGEDGEGNSIKLLVLSYTT